MRTNILLCTLALFVCVACLSCTESPVNKTTLSKPVVTGIFIFDDNGTPIGIHGRPADNPGDNDAASEIYFGFLTPNPSQTGFDVNYALHKRSDITVWMVPAQDGINSSSADIPVSDTVTPYQNIIPTYTLLDSTQVERGWYGLRMDGEQYPGGLYRIYIKTDNSLVWRDALLVHSKDDIPPSLRDRFVIR